MIIHYGGCVFLNHLSYTDQNEIDCNNKKRHNLLAEITETDTYLVTGKLLYMP